MTKIDIISGFLGAGKTTLIQKLLKEAFGKEKIVLIENEFGEIGIDSGFLKDAGIQVTEMNSGCICCSLVGDFGTALKEVLDQYTPDRIIIEPSGVGKLSDVMKAVQDVDSDEMVLNSFTAVVDGMKTKMYMKNFGEFYNNQVEYAKAIIMSRTQKLSEDKLEASVALLREKNAKAAIITTPWDEIDGKQILAAMEQTVSFEEDLMKEAVEHAKEHAHHHDHAHDSHNHEHGEHEHSHEAHHHDHCHGAHEHDVHHHDHETHDHDEHGHSHKTHHDAHSHDHHHGHDEHEHHYDEHGNCSCGHHHDHEHHHADDIFTSWGVETPHKFTKEEVECVLKALAESNEYGVILRAKGMLAGADGQWIYFDLVPGEYELRDGAPEYTGRLCVIGTDLKEEQLKEAFHI
ncbi:MAG: GTP-binding protein [Lachnospiraceae bacterium]|nr:GTP-binding protein [Lachnospiraceae bacterium]